VARITVNLPENIVFQNTDFSEDLPTLSLQLGVWGEESAPEAGVIFDVTGAALPLLSAHDIRKLVKWLNAAADTMDGKKPEKRHKNRPHYSEDDDGFEH